MEPGGLRIAELMHHPPCEYELFQTKRLHPDTVPGSASVNAKKNKCSSGNNLAHHRICLLASPGHSYFKAVCVIPLEVPPHRPFFLSL